MYFMSVCIQRKVWKYALQALNFDFLVGVGLGVGLGMGRVEKDHLYFFFIT